MGEDKEFEPLSADAIAELSKGKQFNAVVEHISSPNVKIQDLEFSCFPHIILAFLSVKKGQDGIELVLNKNLFSKEMTKSEKDGSLMKTIDETVNLLIERKMIKEAKAFARILVKNEDLPLNSESISKLLIFLFKAKLPFLDLDTLFHDFVNRGMEFDEAFFSHLITHSLSLKQIESATRYVSILENKVLNVKGCKLLIKFYAELNDMNKMEKLFLNISKSTATDISEEYLGLCYAIACELLERKQWDFLEVIFDHLLSTLKQCDSKLLDVLTKINASCPTSQFHRFIDFSKKNGYLKILKRENILKKYSSTYSKELITGESPFVTDVMRLCNIGSWDNIESLLSNLQKNHDFPMYFLIAVDILLSKDIKMEILLYFQKFEPLLGLHIVQDLLLIILSESRDCKMKVEREGLSKLTFLIIREMAFRGRKMNAQTYNIAFRTFSLSGSMEEVTRTMEIMRSSKTEKPDSRSYASAILAASVAQDKESVTKFYTQMVSSGVSIDQCTLQKIILAYTNIEEFSKAFDIFRESRLSFTSTKAVELIMRMFFTANAFSYVLEIFFLHYLKTEIKSPMMYHLAVLAAIKVKGTDLAESIFSQMQENNLDSLPCTKEILMKSLLYQGKFGNAMKLLMAMYRENQPLPRISAIVSLTFAVVNNDFRVSKQLVEKMRKDRVILSRKDYGVLSKALSKCHDEKITQLLLDL